jgi:hypothetical protein
MICQYLLLNYNEKGEPTYSNVRGQSYPVNAFSYAGGLLVAGGASSDVEANGNVIPINNASWLEFIATYNDRCQFEKIINIWEMEPSQYPNSGAQMDMLDGTVYISGTYYAPLNVAGFGVIGQEGGEYFYVLKFDKNLDLRGVFTAGFDQSAGEYGTYRNIIVSPDVNGNVVVTGSFETDRAPVIGDVQNIRKRDMGFAVKLDKT